MRYRYAACCLAIRDEFCLEESIAELRRQGVDKVLIVSPQTYWADGSPQSRADLDALGAIACRTGAELVSCEFKTNETGAYAALATEAMYRNYGLDLLFSDPQVDFVLTVDADELWLPGTLAVIDAVAEPGSKVLLPCIPVIGVPGLPVAGAKDQMLVATARGLRFDWGRAVKDAPARTAPVAALHFSATRRTLAEVVAKSRQSAHYHDPHYDFEGWIANVLPHIRPGQRNVHMYTPGVNIWPEVRAWTAAEWASIPDSLKPHLKHEEIDAKPR